MSALPETLCGSPEELEAWRDLRRERDAYDVAVLNRGEAIRKHNEIVDHRAEALRAAQARFDVASRLAPAVPAAAQPAVPSGVGPDDSPAPTDCGCWCMTHKSSGCACRCPKHHEKPALYRDRSGEV